jgi:hypothetical protein
VTCDFGPQRARNLRALATTQWATGDLREDLTDDQVAEIVWMCYAAEYWDLLVQQRGLTPAEFATWGRCLGTIALSQL